MAPAKCSSESPLRAAGRWAPRAVHLRSRCFQKVAEKGGTVADCTSLNIVYGNYTSSISRVASLSVKRYLILVSHTKMCKNRLTISKWSLLWMSNFEGTARKKAFMWQTIGGFSVKGGKAKKKGANLGKTHGFHEKAMYFFLSIPGVWEPPGIRRKLFSVSPR